MLSWVCFPGLDAHVLSAGLSASAHSLDTTELQVSCLGLLLLFLIMSFLGNITSSHATSATCGYLRLDLFIYSTEFPSEP